MKFVNIVQKLRGLLKFNIEVVNFLVCGGKIELVEGVMADKEIISIL